MQTMYMCYTAYCVYVVYELLFGSLINGTPPHKIIYQIEIFTPQPDTYSPLPWIGPSPYQHIRSHSINQWPPINWPPPPHILPLTIKIIMLTVL